MHYLVAQTTSSSSSSNNNIKKTRGERKNSEIKALERKISLCLRQGDVNTISSYLRWRRETKEEKKEGGKKNGRKEGRHEKINE